jgi:hypothetical protein
VKTVWFKNCRTEKEKDERKHQLVSADAAFKVLTGILDEKINAMDVKRNSSENYNLPAYAEMQADASGYTRALREVQSLITEREVK